MNVALDFGPLAAPALCVDEMMRTPRCLTRDGCGDERDRRSRSMAER
jgi:hypothetical protein